MVFRSITLAVVLAAGALAQINSFPKRAYFRETFQQPDTRIVLAPPVRLQDFVQKDRLELSLKDYLELVLANNTDIQIQKLTVETPKNQLLRAFAPFDPLATASFTSQRSKSPSSSALEGASTVNQLSQPARFGYSQTLETGTQYTVTYAAQKISNNSSLQTFNPSLTSNFGVNFVQPLLKNRGREINRLNISVARSRLKMSGYDLHDAVLRLVEAAENTYWDLVLARENLAVQEKALGLANLSLKRAQRELELGALSPLDIYQPQQVQASAEIAVSQAKFTLAQRENALRKQISVDLNPEIRKLPIVLTEDVLKGAGSAAVEPEQAISKALNIRPDLLSDKQSLDIDELQARVARNAMLPDVSLTGAYTAQGRGGPFVHRSNVFGADGTASSILATVPGGFGDSLGQMFGLGYPVYSFGVNIRLPIRNRAAAADLADALVAKKRDMLTLRTDEQIARLDVLTWINSVESSKASIKLATVAQDFAQKRLEAEQKKYDLGTTQIYFVLQAQQDLVTAQSTLVSQSIQYRRNMLGLLRRTGELLEERGVRLQ